MCIDPPLNNELTSPRAMMLSHFHPFFLYILGKHVRGSTHSNHFLVTERLPLPAGVIFRKANQRNERFTAAAAVMQIERRCIRQRRWCALITCQVVSMTLQSSH